MEQFLNQLPKSVVKNGKIIDIRNTIGDQIHVSNKEKIVQINEYVCTSTYPQYLNLSISLVNCGDFRDHQGTRR